MNKKNTNSIPCDFLMLHTGAESNAKTLVTGVYKALDKSEIFCSLVTNFRPP